ncbi:MAG: class I SAM-dependent methyltransferase [Chloroflexi bacterium]|nr:class I SAM-dependent methyltransferase [Chloroflexota bacterium]
MKRIPESEAIAEMTDARRFSEVMSSNQFRQADYRRLARLAVDMGLPPGAKVLDMGTGPGFVAIEVARLLKGTECQVVGMDLSGSMLALAAENAAKAGVNSILTWREGDVKAMPFDDGEFDLVVSNDSLHHWDDPLPGFDEVARVLKDDGLCIIHDSKRLQHWWPWLFVKTISLTIPPDFRIHWWNSIKSSYTAQELQAILERSRLTGWRIEESFMDLMVVREESGYA